MAMFKPFVPSTKRDLQVIKLVIPLQTSILQNAEKPSRPHDKYVRLATGN